jgi:hypothetical protein
MGSAPAKSSIYILASPSNVGLVDRNRANASSHLIPVDACQTVLEQSATVGSRVLTFAVIEFYGSDWLGLIDNMVTKSGG